MNEGQKAMKNIELLITIFFVIFVIYASLSTVLSARILTDVKAFNECSRVDDAQFKSCYESAKQ